MSATARVERGYWTAACTSCHALAPFACGFERAMAWVAHHNRARHQTF